MGFLDGIADIAIRGVVGYASSISEAKEAAETLAIAESMLFLVGASNPRSSAV